MQQQPCELVLIKLNRRRWLGLAKSSYAGVCMYKLQCHYTSGQWRSQSYMITRDLAVIPMQDYFKLAY